MNQLTPIQRAEIVKLHFENGSSIVKTQRAYKRLYPRETRLSHTTIRNLVKKFMTTGSCATSWQPRRPRSRRSNENIAAVQADVRENPNTSYRRRALQLGLSATTLRRILKDDLHLFPYKVQITQRLLPQDKPRRLAYAHFVENMLHGDGEFWFKIIMSDEAHFTLNGAVNKQNCRFWADENPCEIFEEPLHDQKVTVWCGVSAKKIIGPYFFENEAGKAVTINGARYRAMLRDFVFPEMTENGMADFWFQQDGATAHTTRDSMTLLRTMFDRRVISKNGDFDWPPRSPDLTPPDFFLWGYLKSKVYIDKPQTIPQLKANIHREISLITTETLENVMQNARKRALFCIKHKGGHLLDIIFKT